jgi:hypothetical protein
MNLHSPWIIIFSSEVLKDFPISTYTASIDLKCHFHLRAPKWLISWGPIQASSGGPGMLMNLVMLHHEHHLQLEVLNVFLRQEDHLQLVLNVILQQEDHLQLLVTRQSSVSSEHISVMRTKLPCYGGNQFEVRNEWPAELESLLTCGILSSQFWFESNILY